MIGVIGEALVDLVIAPDGSVVAHLGGAPFNAARAAGRLGADVSFYGVLSLDRFGQALSGQLTADGVDITHAARVEQPTTLAAAELDAAGAATYRFYTAGTSAPLFDAAVVPRSSVDLIVTGGLALVLQPMADEVDRLVNGLDDRVALMVDVNCRPQVIDDRDDYQRRVERIVARAHVVKVSTDDLRYLRPDLAPLAAARALVALSNGAVLLTDGGADVVVLTTAGERSVAVPQVDVVDSVGAGDAFCGGFIASAQARRSNITHVASGALSLDQLVDLVEDAVGVAALACQRAGANPPFAADVPGWPLMRRDVGAHVFEVVDHAPHAWFLFEDRGALFLDVNCNHSAIGYSWMIELNADELQRHATDGRTFIDQLADAIHMSAPIGAGSTSPFRSRNMSSEHSDAAQDAIRRWKDRQAGS